MPSAIDFKELVHVLLIILVLGGLILFLRTPISEGFASDAIACGVNNPCSGFLKCVNGFCAKTDPIGVVETAPVPLLIPGGPAPYF